MSKIAVEHVKHVHAVVRGCLKQGSDVADYAAEPQHGSPDSIIQSWVRCLNEYSLYPDHQEDPYVVAAAELQERQARLATLLQVARVEMANLYQQLALSGYAIMLTDSDGVLLDIYGDPGFTQAASRSGLLPGAVWSERLQGTNGMGTCLVEKRPLIVHQNQHYLVRNIGISCAAAPICNELGEVIAVLDASGEARQVQQQTLVLVNMAAQMIENAVFLRRFEHAYLLRFHARAEFVGTLSEGVLALDAGGNVLAATRCALFQLGAVAPAELCGRGVDELFQLTFAALLDSSIRTSFQPLPLFAPRGGARFFGALHAPRPPALARSAAAAMAPPSSSAALGLAPGGARPAKVNGISLAATPLDLLQHGDAVMAANVQTAKRLMQRDVAIVLHGETGTGKELFAKAIHQSGPRAHKPFVAINCAAIPETLIESELFGYKSGAFTGANKEGQHGKLFQANGGTLFLDEIGDMPVLLQARLLRVLEEREVQPLGASAPVKLDIRLISATHTDLQQKIAAGAFREDLYYRLQGVTLSLPPLRQRSDRRALIAHVLARECCNDGQVELDDALFDVLDRHPWPGNVRQLRQLLRTMIALRCDDVLGLADLPPGFDAAHGAAPAGGAAVADTDGPLNPLEHAERDALSHELEKHHWNISTLARQLKMSRNTLYRKIRRLDLKDPGKVAMH